MNSDNQHHQQQQQQQQQQLEPNHANELEKRDRSIVSQVHFSRTASDVSSITDYDISSHTEAEMRRCKKDKELYAKKQAASMLLEGGCGEDSGRKQNMNSDGLIAGFDEGQLERMIADPDAPALATIPLIQAKRNTIPDTSVVSSGQHNSVTSSQHTSTKSDNTPMLSNISPKIFTSDSRIEVQL
eukprot:CAMPEP_0201660438 /NCGR_PEP_ID=MMETSP0494-20130426/3082_1 /ASSEMBLY_ACC=CAM_ASM_000839 /TAXON_ID=420259 /ORGANISM="Thalassiosira gravida, Strain GMp14c1" /LENGTH=184 /DNA_ID=CAMNT_0048138311 /DNA_START=41 /DNA_END=595 /DNA_ORIENTATION=+